ncbi:hypothetical protein I5Q83_09695 [Enterocloster clostridioformis]|uniref:hypothetical protein n=1 Tax=Enterocloster clostridioformis TaxID=1531 RepID=UPI0012443596|nr:hypothetical protein [Enterocloster clostridioformis]NDO29135.1 hypothetical protein [Enterocloster clostridioformis]QQR02510.1 hypothetical protein I5Q83_09695 [Enterocloster clostridioformis]
MLWPRAAVTRQEIRAAVCGCCQDGAAGEPPVQLPIFSPESALESELENGGNMGIILNPQEDGADDATSRKEMPG